MEMNIQPSLRFLNLQGQIAGYPLNRKLGELQSYCEHCGEQKYATCQCCSNKCVSEISEANVQIAHFENVYLLGADVST